MALNWKGKKIRFKDFLRVGHAGFALQFLTQLLVRLCVYMREADLRSDSCVNRVEKIHSSIFGYIS